jgi:predicted N-acetyltransferase YhbS
MLDRSTPIVRRARRDDIPDIVSLTAAALEGFRGAVPDTVLGLYIAYSCDVAGRWNSGDVLVAESDEGITGTVTYSDRNETDRALPAAWATFRSLMVHPDAQGSGLGRRLTDHCIEAGRRSGASSLGIHSADFHVGRAPHLRSDRLLPLPRARFSGIGILRLRSLGRRGARHRLSP